MKRITDRQKETLEDKLREVLGVQFPLDSISAKNAYHAIHLLILLEKHKGYLQDLMVDDPREYDERYQAAPEFSEEQKEEERLTREYANFRQYIKEQEEKGIDQTKNAMQLKAGEEALRVAVRARQTADHLERKRLR